MDDEPRTKRKRAHFSHDAAMIQLADDAKVVSRANVERIAGIVGEDSAAADALKRADEYKGPVRFWYSASQGMLSVQLLQDTRQ
jgi:hypothetical protein